MRVRGKTGVLASSVVCGALAFGTVGAAAPATADDPARTASASDSTPSPVSPAAPSAAPAPSGDHLLAQTETLGLFGTVLRPVTDLLQAVREAPGNKLSAEESARRIDAIKEALAPVTKGAAAQPDSLDATQPAGTDLPDTSAVSLGLLLRAAALAGQKAAGNGVESSAPENAAGPGTGPSLPGTSPSTGATTPQTTTPPSTGSALPENAASPSLPETTASPELPQTSPSLPGNSTSPSAEPSLPEKTPSTAPESVPTQDADALSDEIDALREALSSGDVQAVDAALQDLLTAAIGDVLDDLPPLDDEVQEASTLPAPLMLQQNS